MQALSLYPWSVMYETIYFRLFHRKLLFSFWQNKHYFSTNLMIHVWQQPSSQGLLQTWQLDGLVHQDQPHPNACQVCQALNISKDHTLWSLHKGEELQHQEVGHLECWQQSAHLLPWSLRIPHMWWCHPHTLHHMWESLVGNNSQHCWHSFGMSGRTQPSIPQLLCLQPWTCLLCFPPLSLLQQSHGCNLFIHYH